MKIDVQRHGNGMSVEVPNAVAQVLERIASPMAAIGSDGQIQHPMGPLIELGNEKPASIRRGWVAQVMPRGGNAKLTTITTTKGFVFDVDEEYRLVQQKLHGIPKKK